MKILVILGHPDKGSFNHAIANTAVEALNDNGHEVMFHDLYEEGFNPILPAAEISKEAALDGMVRLHCDEVASADGIIIVHPNWWGQPPALLKGWIDRVIRPGVAYEFTEDDSGEGVPVGLLKAKSVLIFNTSNTPEKREREVFGDPLERIWKDCIFDLCGVKEFYRKMFRVVVTSTDEQRKSWLDEARQTVGRYYPIDAASKRYSGYMKKFFEFDGEKYKAASRHQKEWGNKMIAELELSGDEAVLDLGCGDGVLTAQLAELVPKGSVLGVDASEGMMATAGQLKNDNLSFRLMDINTIDFDHEFDLVFSNATLHWIKDHRSLLKNIYKSLKPGGAIRLNFAADGNCSAFESIAKAIIKEARYSGYFSDFEWPWFTPGLAEYELLARESEFKDIKVWGENADRYFNDTNELIGWLDQPSLVPFMRRIDVRDKAAFRDTFIDRMIERTVQSDGRCFETFRRINVFAKK